MSITKVEAGRRRTRPVEVRRQAHRPQRILRWQSPQVIGNVIVSATWCRNRVEPDLPAEPEIEAGGIQNPRQGGCGWEFVAPFVRIERGARRTCRYGQVGLAQTTARACGLDEVSGHSVGVSVRIPYLYRCGGVPCQRGPSARAASLEFVLATHPGAVTVVLREPPTLRCQSSPIALDCLSRWIVCLVTSRRSSIPPPRIARWRTAHPVLRHVFPRGGRPPKFRPVQRNPLPIA